MTRFPNLALHEATGEQRWLDDASEMAEIADELFWDSENAGYYFAESAPDLIARSKSTSDGAIPSGNSAMLHGLVGLWRETRDTKWKQRTEQMLGAFGGLLIEAPTAQVHMVHALERWLRPDESGANTTGPEVTLPDLSGTTEAVAPLDGADQVNVKVSVDPHEVESGSTFTVRVALDIAAGWHINANPASNPNLIPTLIDLRSNAPVEVVSVTYPEGTDLKPMYAEQPIRVYEGTAEIVITAKLNESVSPGDLVTIPVFVQFQVCDESRCLRPTERIVETSFTVSD